MIKRNRPAEGDLCGSGCLHGSVSFGGRARVVLWHERAHPPVDLEQDEETLKPVTFQVVALFELIEMCCDAPVASVFCAHCVIK